MIKIIVTAAVASVFAATAALAADANFAAVDANSDGAVTMEELLAVNPNVTADQFKAADADGSGSLSEDEFIAVTG